MATSRVALTESYQQIAAAQGVLVVQGTGSMDVCFNGSAPADSDPGHNLKRGCIYTFDDLAALGGDAWVRGEGFCTYTTGTTV